MMVKSGLDFFYFEIEQAPSELSQNKWFYHALILSTKELIQI